MNFDLNNPSYNQEINTHKNKRLVATPNSYFMDVRCSCGNVVNCFSHAQNDVRCDTCTFKVATSTGGKVKLTPGVAYKVKNY